jgi:malate/lactate dehydrogenase
MILFFFSYDQYVFLLLSGVIGEDGVEKVLIQKLSEEEEAKIRKSAEEMTALQNTLNFS